MRIHFRLCPIALLIVGVPTLAFAQNPPKQPDSPSLTPPSIQPSTLTMEIVKSLPVEIGRTVYERAGLKPTSYRLAATPGMTGATWLPFQEGATTTRVVNGRTLVSGSLYKMAFLSGQCGDRNQWVTTYLQFRVTPLGGTPIVSNIKGDSVCVHIE